MHKIRHDECFTYLHFKHRNTIDGIPTKYKIYNQRNRENNNKRERKKHAQTSKTKINYAIECGRWIFCYWLLYLVFANLLFWLQPPSTGSNHCTCTTQTHKTIRQKSNVSRRIIMVLRCYPTLNRLDITLKLTVFTQSLFFFFLSLFHSLLVVFLYYFFFSFAVVSQFKHAIAFI